MPKNVVSIPREDNDDSSAAAADQRIVVSNSGGENSAKKAARNSTSISSGRFIKNACGQYFTVEPALFLYMVSSFLHFPVFQALIYEKSCLTIHRNDDDVEENGGGGNWTHFCANDTATHKNLQIQSMANYVFMLSSVCFTIPSFISTIFLGSYADRGGRKLSLLLPYVGLVLSDVNFIVQATFMRAANVYYLLISDFVFALFGGYSGIISTSFSYGSRITAVTNRSYRMAFLEGTIGAGGTIGYLFSGIILKAAGYRAIFLTNMVLHCAAFGYLCVRTKNDDDDDDITNSTSTSIGSGGGGKITEEDGVEEEQEEEERENQAISTTGIVARDSGGDNDNNGVVSSVAGGGGSSNRLICCQWFLAHLRDALSVFKKRADDKRPIIITVFIAFSASFIVFSGSQDIMFYYLKHELNWSSTTYGIFRGVYFGSSSAMILFMFPLLKYRGVQDWKLSAVGLLSRLIGSFMLCFPFRTWFVFCVAFFYMFNRFAAAGMRSIVSQQVERDEQGKVFAAIALIEAICSLVASLLFNSLYAWSLSFYPGFCYALMTALMTVPLTLIFTIGVRMKKQRSRRNDQLEHNS